jgi:hypothetical protein
VDGTRKSSRDQNVAAEIQPDRGSEHSNDLTGSTRVTKAPAEIVEDSAPSQLAAQIDNVEHDLQARIVAAELAGRTTVADALARRLDDLRRARSSGVVDLAAERTRRLRG